jgi:hypothetical protein
MMKVPQSQQIRNRKRQIPENADAAGQGAEK